MATSAAASTTSSGWKTICRATTGRRDHRDGDKDRAHSHHDVVAEVEQCNVRRLLIFGEGVQAFHFRLPGAVGKKTGRVGNNERIVDPALIDIGLTDQYDGRSWLAFKQGFHSRQGYRLVVCDQDALSVAGWKQLQDTEDQPRDHSQSHKKCGRALQTFPKADKTHPPTP